MRVWATATSRRHRRRQKSEEVLARRHGQVRQFELVLQFARSTRMWRRCQQSHKFVPQVTSGKVARASRPSFCAVWAADDPPGRARPARYGPAPSDRPQANQARLPVRGVTSKAGMTKLCLPDRSVYDMGGSTPVTAGEQLSRSMSCTSMKVGRPDCTAGFCVHAPFHEEAHLSSGLRAAGSNLPWQLCCHSLGQAILQRGCGSEHFQLRRDRAPAP